MSICRRALFVALDKWIWLRGESVGHDESEPLFLPILKGKAVTGGRIVLRRLTDQSVMDILLRRAKQVGLKKTSPHDFRRTFISRSARRGRRHCDRAENGRTFQRFYHCAL